MQTLKMKKISDLSKIIGFWGETQLLTNRSKLLPLRFKLSTKEFADLYVLMLQTSISLKK